MKKQAKRIEIKGLVQGVGFRPFIYRQAVLFGLHGTVENNNRGVKIHVEGSPDKINSFIDSIPKTIPEAASISEMEIFPAEIENHIDFAISRSISSSDEVTEVSPDIGVCKACLEDMKSQEHRKNYPFTNCTNCGPRFTIIRDLPYDRHMTTMEPFPMCAICQKEYADILDRRFHAQPVACNHCGPVYSMHVAGKTITDLSEILDLTATLLEGGKIISIKGLGGYHLACTPFVDDTVQKLRLAKNREGKPFALMFRDFESTSEYLHINDKEKQSLTNWRRPIVLLKMKTEIAPSVSIGLDTVGAMLPYMPFHYMLFEHLKIPALVMTSGNISDEPIVIGNTQALRSLGKISDAVITYNRDIHNRTDDSVAFVANAKERLIRRSRSYAPSPVHLNDSVEGIFAAGAELVNCFAIGKGKQAILSQHIGDLKNLETLEFYAESVDRYKRLFRFKPELAVMDMHPDYLSGRYAQEMGVPVLAVQHHHAHIASCMAEHQIDEKVIGVSLDGTGYGTDGNIWGGEFLVADLLDFERFKHFEYIPQPGGDAVSKNPWRMAIAFLYHYFGDEVEKLINEFFSEIPPDEVEIILFMLKNKVNCPLTSSAGRLFDAVAALADVCRKSSYHAEAPMRLESVSVGSDESYPFEINGTISFKPTFLSIIEDLRNKTAVEDIASKFHQTVVHVILDTCILARKETQINKVVLSGGTFQNKIILEKTEHMLAKNGFEVYSHSAIPSNDGGIALGQMAIAAKRRAKGMI